MTHNVKTNSRFNQNQADENVESMMLALKAWSLSGSTYTIANNTRVYADITGVTVKLHGTDIIHYEKWGNGIKVTLNTNGWYTVTTKARLNQFLPNGIHVYQHDHGWYIVINGATFTYFDGFTFIIPNDTE